MSPRRSCYEKLRGIGSCCVSGLAIVAGAALLGCETLEELDKKLAERISGPADVEERNAPPPRNVVVSSGVTLAPRLQLIEEIYQAKKNANVRAGPSVQTNVVAGLEEGETFKAVGRVENADWILAARDNLAIGYVYGPLVKPLEAPEAIDLGDVTEDEVLPPEVEEEAAVDLDTAISEDVPAEAPAVDLDSVAEDAPASGEIEDKAVVDLDAVAPEETSPDRQSGPTAVDLDATQSETSSVDLDAAPGEEPTDGSVGETDPQPPTRTGRLPQASSCPTSNTGGAVNLDNVVTDRAQTSKSSDADPVDLDAVTQEAPQAQRRSDTPL